MDNKTLQVKCPFVLDTDDPRTISDYDKWIPFTIMSQYENVRDNEKIEPFTIDCEKVVIDGVEYKPPFDVPLKDTVGYMYNFRAVGTPGTYGKRNFKINLKDLKYINSSIVSLNCGNGECYGFIEDIPANKFNLLYFPSSRNLSGDINVLSNLTSLTKLSVADTSISGDINALSNLTSLIWLTVDNTNISGDINVLSNLTSLTKLSVVNTNISGDINALSNLTSLTLLNVFNTNISGDINALSNLTSLTLLNVAFTNISGDISALSNLTSLTSLTGNFHGAIDRLIENMSAKKVKHKFQVIDTSVRITYNGEILKYAPIFNFDSDGNVIIS